MLGAYRRRRRGIGRRRMPLRAHHFCQAKVQHLHLLTFGDEDVRRLDVAVDDPLAVGRVQCVGNLNGDVEQGLAVQRAAGNAVLQRLAIQELHGNEWLSLGLADLIDGADVGMIERRCRAGLAAEALQRLRVLGYVRRKEFESYETAEFSVFGLVDDTHPPAAQLLGDAVMRDCLADHDAYILTAEPCVATHCHLPSGIFTQVSVQRSCSSKAFPASVPLPL